MSIEHSPGHQPSACQTSQGQGRHGAAVHRLLWASGARPTPGPRKHSHASQPTNRPTDQPTVLPTEPNRTHTNHQTKPNPTTTYLQAECSELWSMILV